MVKFQDLKNATGLKELNHHLEARSYIDGFIPTANDLTTFEQLHGQPSSDYSHILRWYNHIKSFSTEEKKYTFGQASTSAAGDSASKKPANDDEFDLFADEDEQDDEKERVKQERLKAYEEKKSKKPALVAKSSIILDIKPWDDECDLKEIERQVRAIQCDGLLWSKEAKILPVAFGIKKLQIGCVVEDDKVGVDFLEENITAIEELVQSVDVVAFNKI